MKALSTALRLSHPRRLIAALLLLGVASCGVTPVAMPERLLASQIDQPRAPFPYNSMFCP